jgi:hypothetical protein
MDKLAEIAPGRLSLRLREGLPSARSHIATLTPEARDAVIRLYFRLLDRASEREPPLH